MSSPSAIVGFLDSVSRNNSIASQIRHDAELTMITYTRQKFLPLRESNHCRIPQHDFKAEIA